VNPFLAFLICIPLVLTIMLDVAAIYSVLFPPGEIFTNAPLSGKIGAICVLTTITAYLLYLLVRTFRRPFLEFKGSEKLPPAAKQQLSNFVLAATCAGPLILIFALIRIQHVRYWIGAGSGILGLFMVYLGIVELNQRRNVLSFGKKESIVSQSEQYKAVISGNRTRNLLIALFLTVALLAWPAFHFSNADRFLSVFDLLGTLFLLASVIFWLKASGVSGPKAD